MLALRRSGIKRNLAPRARGGNESHPRVMPSVASAEGHEKPGAVRNYAKNGIAGQVCFRFSGELEGFGEPAQELSAAGTRRK